MALTRITKGVIKPNENYDTHNINSTGIVTAIGLDINGNGDISGNLSVGGVLSYEDVTNIDSVGLITARDGVFIPDNKKLELGNIAGSGDLQLYHTGVRSEIINNTGDLIIQPGINSNVLLRSQTGSPHFKGVHAAEVELFHNGNRRLQTTDDGITVDKGVTINGIEGGDAQIRLRADQGDDNNDMFRFVVSDGGTGLKIQGYDGSFHSRLTIDTSGNIGVGLETPSARLHVNGVQNGLQARFGGAGTGLGILCGQKTNNNALVTFDAQDATHGTLRFKTAGDERLRITSDGKVGINEDVPLALLHVASDNGQTLPTISASFPLIVTKNSNAGIAIIAKNDAKSILAFGDTDDADRGKIQYLHTADSIQFLTAGDERLHITSGGDLSLRSTTQNAHLGLTANSTAINFTLGSTAGASPRMYFYGTGNGQSSAGDIFTGTGTGGILHYRSGGLIKFEVNSDNSTAEALRIKSDGIIETGTAIDDSGYDTNMRFRIGRAADCNLSIRATGSTTAHTGIDFGDDDSPRQGRISYFHNGDYMTFHTNGTNITSNERLRITSGGSVLIDTTVTTEASTDFDDLIIGSTSDTAKGISIVGSTTGGVGSLAFTDGASYKNQGVIQYRHADDSMRFHTNQYERLRITSGGNLKLPDNAKIELGGGQTDSGDLQIYHNGSHSYIDEVGTGNLYIRNGTKNSIWCQTGGQVNLYYNDAVRLFTSDAGTTIRGEVATSQDYPNFRPTLDLNFATQKKLDPRITYQRTGPASFVNEFGKVVLVGDNVPRFDHDPVTRECKGLLIEESRTNLLKYSVDFASISGYDPNYSNARSTLSSTTEVAPDGTNTASKYVRTAGQGTGEVAIIIGNTLGLSNGTVYTSSIFVKNVGTNNILEFVNVTASTANSDSQFNLALGTITTEGSENTLTTITPYPNDWYRISVTAAMNNLSGYFWIRMYNQPEGDGFIIWGGQVEAGAFPTSYIPTSSAAVTRGADIVDIDEEDFTDFYNQTESTIISSHTLLTGVPNAENVYVYQIQDASTNNAIRVIDKNSSYSNVATALILNSGSSVAHFNNTTDSFTKDKVLVALSVKNNDFAASHNGGTVESDTSGTLATNFNSIGIGRYPPSGGYELNGHFQRFIYYPKQLSDSQLKTLTS